MKEFIGLWLALVLETLLVVAVGASTYITLFCAAYYPLTAFVTYMVGAGPTFAHGVVVGGSAAVGLVPTYVAVRGFINALGKIYIFARVHDFLSDYL